MDKPHTKWRCWCGKAHSLARLYAQRAYYQFRLSPTQANYQRWYAYFNHPSYKG
ncbi:MAG: hypothetical protein GTO63_15865 [Anaerolineae bacterium]|nr:hypothetical protein [Anaerolineae bacterium]NIN96303.1 hypothetical protein [Anaerolineae bacterium]NIQ79323.1 hypothetical protein [Anaerolineae bacterium]